MVGGIFGHILVNIIEVTRILSTSFIHVQRGGNRLFSVCITPNRIMT